jgi:hypothetical protein
MLNCNDAKLEFVEIKVFQNFIFTAFGINRKIINKSRCVIGPQKIQERYGFNSTGRCASTSLVTIGTKSA